MSHYKVDRDIGRNETFCLKLLYQVTYNVNKYNVNKGLWQGLKWTET